jgi:hypothetical protein
MRRCCSRACAELQIPESSACLAPLLVSLDFGGTLLLKATRDMLWSLRGATPGRPAVRLTARLVILSATWRSGYAAACKAVYTGSIPVVAFNANSLQIGMSCL